MPDLAAHIAALASSDARARESAAVELYRRGAALGDAAVAPWRCDPLLSSLLGGTPTIGIAVLPPRFEPIRIAFGSPPLANVPPDQDASEFEVHFRAAEQDILLDILTTVDLEGRGAIARFLRKNGEGIQQVEYSVRDVDTATEIVRRRAGLEPVYSRTHRGANATRVNFFLAPSLEGKKVLVELVEK